MFHFKTQIKMYLFLSFVWQWIKMAIDLKASLATYSLLIIYKGVNIKIIWQILLLVSTLIPDQKYFQFVKRGSIKVPSVSTCITSLNQKLNCASTLNPRLTLITLLHRLLRLDKTVVIPWWCDYDFQIYGEVTFYVNWLKRSCLFNFYPTAPEGG